MLLLALLAFGGVTLACRKESAGNPNQKHYTLKGKVISANPEAKQIIVDGEAIPGFMDAMTMPYRVKDGKLIEGIGFGDEITADVVVDGNDFWLEKVVVVKKADAPAASAAGEFHMPQPGETVPDFVMVNQDGKQVHLAAYRGKSVLLTFIYTQCPFVNFCPLMTKHFASIEKDLAADASIYAKTHLLSISFDTEHDTPAALRKYAAANLPAGKARSSDHWEFATLTPEDRKAAANFFGLTVVEQDGQVIHSLSTAVISPDGKVYRWYHGGDWQPADVLKVLTDSTATKAS
jgi:protein SCO1